jgi:hypothetical protein
MSVSFGDVYNQGRFALYVSNISEPGVLVAVAETILRLAREIHAPYYALFIVAPVTNLFEIWWEARHPRQTRLSEMAPVSAAPSAGGDGASAWETPVGAGPSLK